MSTKLAMELGMRVTPAASTLVESLRVATFLTEGLTEKQVEELDALHVRSIELAEHVVQFQRNLDQGA